MSVAMERLCVSGKINLLSSTASVRHHVQTMLALHGSSEKLLVSGLYHGILLETRHL